MTMTVTALPVKDSLAASITYILEDPLADPGGTTALSRQQLANRLQKIPLPPLLELAAATVSHIHRQQGLPDPIYAREVARAIAEAIHSRSPLTVRCANEARITMSLAQTQPEQDQAAFGLLTINIMREAQPTAGAFSMMTWNDLLDGRHPLTAPTRSLARDLAPADRSARIYPVATGSVNGHLDRHIRHAGLPGAYTVICGPSGIHHDMSTAGALDPSSTHWPSPQEGVDFLEGLDQVPIP